MGAESYDRFCTWVCVEQRIGGKESYVGLILFVLAQFLCYQTAVRLYDYMQACLCLIHGSYEVIVKAMCVRC